MELQMIDTEVFAAAPRPLRLTVRPRPAPSYWSLFVWSVAEGFGGPYMPGTRPPVPIWLHPDSGCDQLCPFGCIQIQDATSCAPLAASMDLGFREACEHPCPSCGILEGRDA